MRMKDELSSQNELLDSVPTSPNAFDLTESALLNESLYWDLISLLLVDHDAQLHY